MKEINHAYINGAFVPVSGTETLESINPTTEEVIVKVKLANREDAKSAIASASKAQMSLRQTSVKERIEMLYALQSSVLARTDDIREITIEEYGGPFSRAQWVSQYAAQCFGSTAEILRSYNFKQRIGDAEVIMSPVGVSSLIVPWNSLAGSMCSKLASTIAAGSASVIKPSEFSPLQAQIITEALHDAGLPAGFFNVVLGRGEDVGHELTTHPDVSKISFTGSTQTGKMIYRSSTDSLKRVSLALTGKSASIVLEDADFSSAITMALNVAFMNNGQACVAGTRLLVPRNRLDEVNRLLKDALRTMPVGDPKHPETVFGPLASKAQYERIQRYIQLGTEQGADIISGGLGRPDGFPKGYFVTPTIFTNVKNSMTIAREEIFGPVLSVIPYDHESEAIEIANDSDYGLQAYVFSKDVNHASQVAIQLEAGTVMVNRIIPELIAPFGGVKQSGIGREFGLFGMEAFLEPKSLVV
jgi:aldehyde dehydrogenase (NAD+)